MNCSATGQASVVQRWLGTASCYLCALLIFIGTTSRAQAQSAAELDDAAARLQYAFLTADTRALEDVLALVSSYEVDGRLAPIKEYQLAYGHWKLAELYAQTARSDRRAAGSSAKAAKTCSTHARAAARLDSRMAEAYALEAACEGMPQGFLRLAGVGAGDCAGSKALRMALSLAPRNPRVLFVEALCTKTGTASENVNRWRRVADAFAAAPPVSPGHADWGQPEALTLLGESYLQQNNTIAARDALERALVLAPDYEAAQQLLQTVAHAPSQGKLQR
jgi:tetratricopeptide (TPR) repeat protein